MFTLLGSQGKNKGKHGPHGARGPHGMVWVSSVYLAVTSARIDEWKKSITKYFRDVAGSRPDEWQRGDARMAQQAVQEQRGRI